MGGVARAPSGQLDALATVAVANTGATNLGNVTTEEGDFSVQYGASSQWMVGKLLGGMGDDWGNVGSSIGMNGGIPGNGGRAFLWFSRHLPQVDTSSPAAIAESAGRNLPDFDYGIFIGSAIHEFPFGPKSKFLAFLQQFRPNNNGHGATSAAQVKPMKLGWGLDFWGVNVVNQAFRSSGFQLQGTGEVDIGSAALTPTPGGLTIDPTALYRISNVAVVNGGARFRVGDTLNGPVGDIYTVSKVVNGSITSLEQTVIGYSKTPFSHPNPVTLLGGTGANPAVMLSWTEGSSISIAGHVRSSGPSPAEPIACGSAPSMMAGSTDARGTIHIGLGNVTGCTLTFAKPYGTPPQCLVNVIVSGRPIAAAMSGSSKTTTTFAFASPAGGGTAIYNCWE